MGRTKCASNSESLNLKAGGGSSGKAGGGAGRPKGEGRVGQAAAPPQKTGFDGRLEAPWRRIVKTPKFPCTLVHTTSKRTQKPPAKLTVAKEREKSRQVIYSNEVQ